MKLKHSIIIEVLGQAGASRPADLAKTLKISTQALHRSLKELLDLGLIVKKGSAPVVFYDLAPSAKIELPVIENADHRELIARNFSLLSNQGVFYSGIEAFARWLHKTKQEGNAAVLARTYYQLVRDIQSQKSGGFYSLKEKISNTFSDAHLKDLYCSDFYSLPQFGKTFLGNLVVAGKSGQSVDAIEQVCSIIKDDLTDLIKQKKISYLVWTPHSISRKVLFLRYLKKFLSIGLPEIEFVKAYAGQVPIAQKSLSRLQDRVENAKETIHLKSGSASGKNVLIIDDALGSGATVNEISKKITDANNIYAYAVVGSFKGFDVINVV